MNSSLFTLPSSLFLLHSSFFTLPSSLFTYLVTTQHPYRKLLVNKP